MLFERASHCYHSIHQEPNFWWVCHKIYGYRAVEQFNADEVYKINFKVWDNMNNRKLFSKQQSWLIANKLGSSYSKLSMLKLKLQVIKRWLTNSRRVQISSSSSSSFFFFGSHPTPLLLACNKQQFHNSMNIQSAEDTYY